MSAGKTDESAYPDHPEGWIHFPHCIGRRMPPLLPVSHSGVPGTRADRITLSRGFEMQLTICHVDTCLPGYVPNHCNGDNELARKAGMDPYDVV